MLNILSTWLLKVRSFPDRSRSAKGFTLMELLIAASLTLFVVGIAGWALVTITKSNKIAKATSELQYDYNRAIDFVGEELKGSKKIYTGNLNDASVDRVREVTNGYLTKRNWMIPVFAFLPDENIPGSANVVYYIVDTSQSGAPGDGWAGRYVLYRWGPAYDADGKYSRDTTDPTKIQHPSQWQGNALVDLVLGTWQNVDATKRLCRRPTDVDPQQWKRYPANDTDQKGFFICVPTAGSLAGKQAEIHALGEIPLDPGKNAYLGKKPLVYEVVTEAFLRSAISANYVATNGGLPVIVPSSVPGSCTGNCTTPISPVDDKKPLTVTLNNLHGNCTAEAVDVNGGDLGSSPTRTVLPGGTGSFPDVNESMVFRGKSGACSGVNTRSSASNYKPGFNGMALSDITASISDATMRAESLQRLKTILGSRVDANGRIALAPGQFLMFFEQFPSQNDINSGETAILNNDKLYDDMILLATVQ